MILNTFQRRRKTEPTASRKRDLRGKEIYYWKAKNNYEVDFVVMEALRVKVTFIILPLR